ncbi:hypothetical protein PG987_015503 [Apiospora arundinis]
MLPLPTSSSSSSSSSYMDIMSQIELNISRSLYVPAGPPNRCLDADLQHHHVERPLRFCDSDLAFVRPLVGDAREESLLPAARMAVASRQQAVLEVSDGGTFLWAAGARNSRAGV